MTPLERQIKKGQSQHLILLPAPDARNVVVSSVVALLNSGGGTLVVGVDEAGNPVGLSGAANTANSLALHLREVISPRPLLSVTAEDAFGSEVIVIEVPGGRDMPFLSEGRVHLQRGTRTVVANAADLQGIFQRRAPEPARWERRGSPTLELDDLDHKQIETTVQTAVAGGRYHFDDTESAEAVLRELGMLSGGVLTNAADVCFGRKPSTRHP